MFRVSHEGRTIDYAKLIEDAREIVRNEEPGCYDVDEIRVNSFASNPASRRWGRLTRQPYGLVDDDRWAWSALPVDGAPIV